MKELTAEQKGMAIDELKKLLDYVTELEQNCIKHGVSGSDPLYQLAKEIGFENVSEDDLQKVIDKTKGLRSASGAVDKTVREGVNGGQIGGLDAYQNILEP